MADSWEGLFERATEYEITLDDITHILEEHRDG